MSPDELDGVATFYNLIFRRPVGRHVILICDSVSCWIMATKRCAMPSTPGSACGWRNHCRRPLHPPAHRLSRRCDHAPTIMIDDDLHHDVDPARLDALLEQYP